MPAAPEPDGGLLLAVLAEQFLSGFDVVVLAVSGGADSMALIELAREWRASRPSDTPQIHVATVDHGLRAGSVAEAAFVSGAASTAGLPHHTLHWSGGRAHAAGLQAAARDARYHLLRELAGRLGDEHGPGSTAAIVTAHHLDDQAETLLMRLARGSGVDGLAAMPPTRQLPDIDGHSLTLVRPFLAHTKADLTDYLRGCGRTWIEDPSNQDERFERVRVRNAMSTLAATGISADAIARSAVRLRRARAALDAATLDLLANATNLHDGAYAEIRAAPFAAAPAEIRLRLLQCLWRGFGGPGPIARLSQLEDVEARLMLAPAADMTLAGGHIRRSGDTIVLFRESGRNALPAVPLAPGTVILWDGRFNVSASPNADAGLEIKPLPAAALSDHVEQRDRRRLPSWKHPREALLTLPSLWRGKTFLGVLHPIFDPSPALPAVAGFAAIGLRPT